MSGSKTIHDLVREGNIDEIRAYIATGGDINSSDKHQRTPLHLAAWSANYEILDLLLKSKANVEKKAMDNFTILHFAVQSSNKDVERVMNCIRLIVKKAKQLLNQRTSKGNKSAIHLAVLKGNEDVVKCILECGIDANAKMSNGQTPLDIAKTEAMKCLLRSTHTSNDSTTAHSEESMENNKHKSSVTEQEENDEDEVQPVPKKRKVVETGEQKETTSSTS